MHPDLPNQSVDESLPRDETDPAVEQSGYYTAAKQSSSRAMRKPGGDSNGEMGSTASLRASGSLVMPERISQFTADDVTQIRPEASSSGPTTGKPMSRKVYLRLDYEGGEPCRSSYRENLDPKDPAPAHVFPSNKTRTALYTPCDLFPRAFFLQFTKLANVYWGVAALLQFYRPIRTGNPAVILFFLLFVVLIGVAKEWASDSKRQRADRAVNNARFKRVSRMAKPAEQV